MAAFICSMIKEKALVGDKYMNQGGTVAEAQKAIAKAGLLFKI